MIRENIMFTFQIWILVQINKCISIWESVCASSQAHEMFAKELDARSSPKRHTIHYLVMFSLASFPSSTGGDRQGCW